MVNKSTFYFEANKLWIEKETGADLIANESPVAVYSVKVAAVEIIQRGGTFIINDDNVGILRRCDRLSELDALMRDVDNIRRQKGLQNL